MVVIVDNKNEEGSNKVIVKAAKGIEQDVRICSGRLRLLDLHFNDHRLLQHPKDDKQRVG